jgi:hypothetical protein
VTKLGQFPFRLPHFRCPLGILNKFVLLKPRRQITVKFTDWLHRFASFWVNPHDRLHFFLKQGIIEHFMLQQTATFDYFFLALVTHKFCELLVPILPTFLLVFNQLF